MADSILKIRTQDGDKPIGYPGLADKPVSDKTLSVEGAFADSKAVGDKFAKVDSETASLKEDIEGITKKHVNLLENLQFYPGEFYTYESHNVSENSDFGRFELFNIKANEIYYFKNIFFHIFHLLNLSNI